MAIWQKAKVKGTTPGSRVEVDATGASWVKILSESFRSHDSVDFATLGRGCDVIYGGTE